MRKKCKSRIQRTGGENVTFIEDSKTGELLGYEKRDGTWVSLASASSFDPNMKGVMAVSSGPGYVKSRVAKRVFPSLSLSGSYALASEIPAVTVSASGAASAIASAVRVYPTVKDATYADHLNDPIFRIVGVPDGKMLVAPSGTIEGGLFTGATSGGSTAYWQPLIETSWLGTKIEFRLRSKSTGTVYYRLYVNGQPVTDTFQSFAGASGGSYNILLTFASAGARVVGIEFAYAQFGGVLVEPTASLCRPKVDRQRIAFLGNSILAGYNPIQRHNTWAGHAARLLGMDCYNASVGQTGFVALAPYAPRVADIAACAPDVIVVGDPYNDIGQGQAAVQAATRQTLDAILTQCPSASVIMLGCWSPSQAPSAPLLAYDADQQALAQQYGIPFLSYIDAGDAMASTPAWNTGTAYLLGQRVTNAGIVWQCTAAHTAATSFDSAKFQPLSLVTTANAATVLLGDGRHPVEQFHLALGALMARRIAQVA